MKNMTKTNMVRTFKANLKNELVSRGLRNVKVKHSPLREDNEFIHLSIEAWSTFKYSIRVSDYKFVRNYFDENAPTWGEPELISNICRNVQDWADFVNFIREL